MSKSLVHKLTLKLRIVSDSSFQLFSVAVIVFGGMVVAACGGLERTRCGRRGSNMMFPSAIGPPGRKVQFGATWYVGFNGEYIFKQAFAV